jgi:hypothetical protein
VKEQQIEQQIWKFPLQLIDTQIISMPYAAKILCVQIQNGVPCLWALCNTNDGVADVTIDIFGTGHSIMDLFTRTYIGTVQMGGGMLVWHVFERHT